MDWGFGELHRVASVAVGAPKNARWVRHICHKLPVIGEGDEVRGNAVKEWLELLCLQIKADEFAMARFPRREDLLSVFAGNGLTPRNRTGGQLNGLGERARQHPAPLRQCPNLRLCDGSTRSIHEYE